MVHSLKEESTYREESMIGKHEEDKLPGIERQQGCSGGWFMTFARCPSCKKTMWSNKKTLYCPQCCTSKEIK